MASFNITSGTTTAQQTLDTGESGIVAFNASLTFANGPTISLVGNYAGTTESPTIFNAGTISSTLGTAPTIWTFGNTASGTLYIRNQGLIQSNSGRAVLSSVTTVLDNNGTLHGGFQFYENPNDDIVVIRNNSDITDNADAGAGSDTLIYAAFVGTGVNATLGGSATGFSVNNINFENLYGSNQGDILAGNSVANIVNGLNGNDSIRGDAGNDTLWGGEGNDTLNGEADNDLLYGGAGDDSMVGGAGNDVYQVTDAGDVVTEASGGGDDAVFTTVSWTVTSGNIEGVYALGAGITLTGSAFDDVLTADASGSTLLGGAGNDTLWGQAGADSLLGGADDDVIRGGGGNDVLNGGAGTDQLVGGTGADIFQFLAAGWGYDQIFDFNRAEGDRIAVSSSFNPAMLQLFTIGENSVALFGSDRVDIYGVTNLSVADLIFV